MEFEGSEKKLEIIFNSDTNLLKAEQSVWDAVVKEANATILSMIENDQQKAFLLSESSLFVWSDRILLITCGQTSLISSVQEILKHFIKEDIDLLIYQRKNEYFSWLQPSSFYDDIKYLKSEFEGTALRFGEMDEHHHFIFHTKKSYTPQTDDNTKEFLLYGLAGDVSKMLTNPTLTAQDIRSFLNLDKILNGFIIDDYKFDPYGYSVNAIKDSLYLTIHITPQEGSSYISFETNINLEEHLDLFIEILRPSSFDFINFIPGNETQDTDAVLKVKFPYEHKKDIYETLSCGYHMGLTSIYLTSSLNNKPMIIE